MARDVQIAGAIGAAPQTYEVPNATEIIPRCVRATFNGAGAGSAFFPTVRIISDGGVIVGEVATDTSVAAGASASVTFAPFLRAQASGGGGGGITQITSDGSITVTAPNGPTTNLAIVKPTTGTEIIQDAAFTLNTSSGHVYSFTYNSGPALLNLGTPTLPKVNTAGWYSVSVRAQAGSLSAVGDQWVLALTFFDAAVTTIYSIPMPYNPAAVDFFDYSISGVCYLPANGGFTASISNQSGVTTFTNCVGTAVINWIAR